MSASAPSLPLIFEAGLCEPRASTQLTDDAICHCLKAMMKKIGVREITLPFYVEHIPASFSKFFSSMKIHSDAAHPSSLPVQIKDCKVFQYFVHYLNDSGSTESISLDNDMCDGMDGGSSASVACYRQYKLPNIEFSCLWENLVLEPGVKEELISYVFTSLDFVRNKVDSNIVTWNKLVLLHGPPGTGKSTLCKALAQQIAIRVAHMYTETHFVELNTQALFSRFYSESAKMVIKLFDQLRNMCANRHSLLILMIDEVEALAMSRTAGGGSEPTESVRVVNSLLTQMDNIRLLPNVFVLATSNLTQVIDVAFADRADLKIFLGLPRKDAIFEIILRSVKELYRCGLLQQNNVFSGVEDDSTVVVDSLHEMTALKELAEVCEAKGVSGRTIRRLPLVAMAKLRADVTGGRFVSAVNTKSIDSLSISNEASDGGKTIPSVVDFLKYVNIVINTNQSD